MSACNPFDLLNTAGCFNNLTSYQLQVVETALLCSILQQANPVATCDPLAILEANPCMSNLTPYQLQVISAELLCEILQVGGGGGANACLVAQSGGPVAPCPVSFGIGYDPDTTSPTVGQFWYWDQTDSAWVKFIQ